MFDFGFDALVGVITNKPGGGNFIQPRHCKSALAKVHIKPMPVGDNTNKSEKVHISTRFVGDNTNKGEERFT
ncbi:MAG TPA: hypothetical protein VIM16_02595 [Mucilaginibacter sp.]|jgi:hypothetical protein